MLGVSGADCIVFEDSRSGAIAGLDAGATVVAVGDAPWLSELQAASSAYPKILRVADLSAVSVVSSADSSVVLQLDAMS